MGVACGEVNEQNRELRGSLNNSGLNTWNKFMLKYRTTLKSNPQLKVFYIQLKFNVVFEDELSLL